MKPRTLLLVLTLAAAGMALYRLARSSALPTEGGESPDPEDGLTHGDGEVQADGAAPNISPDGVGEVAAPSYVDAPQLRPANAPGTEALVDLAAEGTPDSPQNQLAREA